MVNQLVDSGGHGPNLRSADCSSAASEVPVMQSDDQQTNPDDAPVDWQVARNLTGGSDDLLQELVQMFPEESARHLEAIGEAIAARDAQTLRRSAHTLKGAAGFFGARRLVACALRMEELGAAEDIDAAQAHFDELRSQTAAVAAAVRHYAG